MYVNTFHIIANTWSERHPFAVVTAVTVMERICARIRTWEPIVGPDKRPSVSLAHQPVTFSTFRNPVNLFFLDSWIGLMFFFRLTPLARFLQMFRVHGPYMTWFLRSRLGNRTALVAQEFTRKVPSEPMAL